MSVLNLFQFFLQMTQIGYHYEDLSDIEIILNEECVYCNVEKATILTLTGH